MVDVPRIPHKEGIAEVIVTSGMKLAAGTHFNVGILTPKAELFFVDFSRFLRFLKALRSCDQEATYMAKSPVRPPFLARIAPQFIANP